MSLKIKPITIGTRIKARIKQQKIHKRNLEEAKLQKLTKDAARSVLKNEFSNFSININEGLPKDGSIRETTQVYSGILGMTNSIWAPWSKSFK